MPQARLIDVNTAAIQYRRLIISSLASQNYASIFGALYTLNAELPSEPVNYRITISTKQYYEKTKGMKIAVCTECSEETDFDNTIKREVMTSYLEQTITGNKYNRIWECPHCKKDCKITRTQFFDQVLQEPHFLQVVPHPPERRQGVMDRNKYHGEVEKWAWLFLGEIEQSIALWRQNYKPKDGMEDDIDFDGGEEA